MEKSTLFSNGYALLIGVGNYPDVTPLPTTVNDATILHKIFTDPSRAGYPPEQVRLLVNENASGQRILDELDWLADRANKNPEATIIVYFSGHGGLRNDQYLLLPFDFKSVDWETTGISSTVFTKKIDAINAKKLVVLLDCCHAAGITTKSGTKPDFIPSNQVLYE
ncbi:MAG: caspase family protein, partial [Chitinophagaceae bacterium]